MRLNVILFQYFIGRFGTMNVNHFILNEIWQVIPYLDSLFLRIEKIWQAGIWVDSICWIEQNEQIMSEHRLLYQNT